MNEKLTPEQISYSLLGILQSYAPTGKEQESFARLYNSLQREGVPHERIIELFAHMLGDGLEFGNWPWTRWTNSRDSSVYLEKMEQERFLNPILVKAIREAF